MPGTNALAFYENLWITAVKSFIGFAPGAPDESPNASWSKNYWPKVKGHCWAVWPDWAKFCFLATFYLSIFLHFQLKLFQNMIWYTYFYIKSSSVLRFWTFNLSHDILATVLATFPNIGRIFVKFCGHSVTETSVCVFSSNRYPFHIISSKWLTVIFMGSWHLADKQLIE